ncbi:MAG TPA: ATP-binding protein, partial [Blastocatellia bacterium]|nr:ATP-binding protein [Blastocatellia bacterium]
IENAIKYTPDGGSVSVSLGACDGAAELAVADTGPGIRAADRERVFERFYRGDESRTTKSVAPRA